METVRQLLLIIVGVLLINLALSALFWWRYRTKLHRGLFWVWATSILAGATQGLPVSHNLGVAFLLLPTGLVSLALADLLAGIADITVRIRVYLTAMVGGAAAAVVIHGLGGAFWMTALPIALAVAVPMLDTGLRVVFGRGPRRDIPVKATALSLVAYGLHILDYPFLRDKPQLTAAAFSIALLVIFAMSITAPGAVLDRVAQERTRVEDINRFQRQFFANITHELRTPLTMILAPLDSLLAGYHGPLTPTQRSYLESNQRNALRLLKLINDLLDLAKMEEGFLRLRVERTDLRPLIEDVVGYVRPLAARKRLSVNLDLNPAEEVEIDPEKIERVIVNLVSNALKFTSVGGVTIGLQQAGEEVKLTVADTGIGIAPSALPQIFERFTQGDGTATRRFGGTGIGLAYAREIVELHGGRIEVDSIPGQGSRFTVLLKTGSKAVPDQVRDRRVGRPSAQRPKRKEDEEPVEWALRLQRQREYRFAEIEQVTNRRLVSRAPAAPTTTGRILVVDDNAEVLELINLALRDQYAIYPAQNGKQGLEVAKRERPDVIITDFMMPEMDGLTMLKALRQEPGLTDVPVIMLTAKVQLEDRLSAREAGADVYLEKPFNTRELDAAIRQLLQKQGRQVQNLMRAHVEGLEIVSAGLAHEIHNPLNFIKNANLLIAENVGKLQALLADMTELQPERQPAIEKIRARIDKMVGSSTRGVERIEKVVDLIRRYAREGYPTEPSEVNFDGAVAEVTELVAPRADMEGRVTERLGAAGKLVRAIPEELNQVIRSLVQNACESVGTTGKVHVETRVDGQQVILEVTDTGPGIAPADVAKIFSPFFTTKPGSGRGMGLAIVQIVIERVGGTVEVTSNPGVATTFRVRLPAADSAPAG